MIEASTAYALCEHVEDRTFRVVCKGSKRKMQSARRDAKRDRSDKSYCVFLAVGRSIGDLIR